MNRRLTPQVERLEDRVVPVIGAAGDALAVARGVTEYDGVVLIQTADGGSGTGALVDTTRHILTAAHVVPAGQASTVLFELERNGRRVDIDFVMPAGAGFTTRHPDWNDRVADGNDLAVLQLVDQEPGMMQTNRQLNDRAGFSCTAG